MENSKVILLVEDNEDDIELTLRALKKSKVLNDVVVARDGEEALDYIFHRGQHSERPEEEKPEVVLLDLKLPKIQGLEVLKEIRKNPVTRFLPVVILTSSSEEEDMVKGYSYGANSFIQKPVDFNRFTEAVKQLELYWLVLNVTPKGGNG